MSQLRKVLVTMVVLIWASAAQAQFGDTPDSDAALGEPQVTRWRVGFTLSTGGPCKGVLATVPVPTDWPEQQVKIVEEDVSTGVLVRYVMLEGGVKQMQARMKQLSAGARINCLVTFEVSRRPQLPPSDPSVFVRPTSLPRDVRRYLAASPFIETTNREVREVANQLGDEKLGAWEQVEVVYDWVRDNVEYKNGNLKGALAALRDGSGDCEEMTSLFIALCRVNKIPARTVWVPDHCYPEFYLQDAEGNGHWFPCQAAGDRAFGEMPERRPILQKGDSFMMPGKRDRQRYVHELLKVASVGGGRNPIVKFHRDLLPSQ